MIEYKRLTLMIFIMFVILLLSACCGKQLVRNMVYTGDYRVELSSEDNNIYKIYSHAWKDYACDYDGNRKEDRLKVINILFEEKCKRIEILDENYIDMMPHSVWVTKIRCQK